MTEAAGANGDLVIGWRLAPLDRAIHELDTTDDGTTLFMARLATGLKRDPYLDAVRGDPCSYCDGPGGTLDHIDPRGFDTRGVHNVTGACASCNQSKRDQSLLAFLLSPRPRGRRRRVPGAVGATPLSRRPSHAEEIASRDRRITNQRHEIATLRRLLDGDAGARELREEIDRLRRALSFIAFAPAREGADPVAVARKALGMEARS